MTSVHAKSVFRDYNTDGVSSSGKFRPKKSELREWGRTLDWIVHNPVAVFDGVDTFTVDYAGAEVPTSYPSGRFFAFRVGAETLVANILLKLNINSVGAKPIQVMNGVDMDNATSDCFYNNSTFIVVFNGTQDAFVLINPKLPRRQVFRVSGGPLIYLDRRNSDGALQIFQRDAVDVGTISVSSGTVSYGSFSGMHWAQSDEGVTYLPGTVLETADAMCVWPEDTIPNLTLPKVQTAGYESSAVYGVFRQYDEDGDIEVAALGVNLVRIAPGMLVEKGDLLISNGHGYAAPQVDDLIRSSTLGKVLNATPQVTYPDGSYLVSCALYCG